MRILVPRQSGETGGIGGNLLVPDEGPVQTRSAATRHQIGDRVVDRIVFAAIVGPMIALEINRLRSLMQNDAALRILRRLRGGVVIGLLMGGNAAKILLDDGHGLGGFDVTNNSD